MSEEQVTHRCPIRGHNHDVNPVQRHTQEGTGKKATTFECPTGNYRWLVIDGRQLSDNIRQVKPRYGWRKLP